jgi:hypothetical protein
MKSAQERCHGLYYTAMRADRAFEKAIKKAAGSRATRWTIKAEHWKNPRVQKAYKRKVAVDRAVHRACDVMRKRPGGIWAGSRRKRRRR